MAVRDVIQAAAGALGGDKLYVEDVFSTWLYTGDDDPTRAIDNGVNLSENGGLIWIKRRNDHPTFGAIRHTLFDTARGLSRYLSTNTSDAQTGNLGNILSATTTGFKFETDSQFYPALLNGDGGLFASWTFRKAPKFFDVVTWTGDGTWQRAIPHNLGTAPGFFVIKVTSTSSDWNAYHRSLGATNIIKLNTTAAATTDGWINNVAPTDTHFTVYDANLSGVEYVAYLFAHDAGGFGDDGLQNVVSCGSFTTDGSGNATVNLGYEPQWVLVKQSNSDGTNWQLIDTMRGFTASNSFQRLFPNSSAAEGGNTGYSLNATGFSAVGNNASGTFIYIAIRRGPMKTPESGTSVFAPQATAGATDGTPNSNRFTSNFPIDLFIVAYRAGSSSAQQFQDRLRSPSQVLISSSTAAETGAAAAARLDDMDGVYYTTTVGANSNVGSWMFRRAPGFFDEVCYTGTGSARTVTHNLGVAPELIITKSRSNTYAWYVYTAATGAGSRLALNTTEASTASSSSWNNTQPTSSVFTVGANLNTNASGGTCVAYLFASCPGVSKVGSYTGTGTTQQINCGFTAGARFVLIKRTDSTGDWYVWDTARGIVSGNDPYLLLNSTAAEVTTTDYVDTYSAGFEISSTAPAAINASGGSFIYLAIA